MNDYVFKVGDKVRVKSQFNDEWKGEYYIIEDNGNYWKYTIMDPELGRGAFNADELELVTEDKTDSRYMIVMNSSEEDYNATGHDYWSSSDIYSSIEEAKEALDIMLQDEDYDWEGDDEVLIVEIKKFYNTNVKKNVTLTEEKDYV